MSATTTASTITTHEVMSGRFWPSTCSQQKATVSLAEADGNSESSATGGFLGKLSVADGVGGEGDNPDDYMAGTMDWKVDPGITDARERERTGPGTGAVELLDRALPLGGDLETQSCGAPPRRRIRTIGVAGAVGARSAPHVIVRAFTQPTVLRRSPRPPPRCATGLGPTGGTLASMDARTLAWRSV
jgi:hypothetical protein